MWICSSATLRWVSAKRVEARLSLGTLFLSAQFLDLLWPLFLLLGLEHARIVPGITAAQPLDFYDYPISHSLLATLGWSVAVGLAYFLFRRRARGAWVVGAVVLSHWLLDFLSHRPDLPILPRGPHVGLGLWNSLPLSLLVELGLFALGILFYLRATKARDWVGRYALVALWVTLLLIQAGSYFGPPPPSMQAVAFSGVGLWLFVLWGYWIDRHRVGRESSP